VDTCPYPKAERRPAEAWYDNMRRGLRNERVAQIHYGMSDSVWMMAYSMWKCPHGLELTRLGPTFEGGKTACLPAPSKRANFADKCLIYSFGSNGQFEFEDDMYKRFGCEIHTFDCTTNPANTPSFVKYHQWCLGLPAADPANNKFMSFWQMVQQLGHQKREPLLVKMDIEGWEWIFFGEYFAENSPIPRISQLLIEIHDGRGLATEIHNAQEPRYRNTAPLVTEVPGGAIHIHGVLNAFIDLEREFDMAAKETNIYCEHCSEFTFVRRNYNWSSWGL
jgi:hypothetical protein